MPIINVQLVEDAFTTEQKRELVPTLTDAVEFVYPGLRSEKVATHAVHNLKD